MLGELDKYQIWTENTAVYPEANSGSVSEIMYLALGLTGEAGEMANRAKKLYRDGNSGENVEKMRDELGDIMWYAARMASALGINLSAVLTANRLKLEDRKRRNALHGSGDNR